MQHSPKSFLPRRLWVLAGLAGALPFVACGTGTTTVDVASETSSLVTAQCDAQSSRAAVDACFETFKTCKAAEGAVEADCKTALDACLPAGVPQRARHGDGRGHGDGGCPGMGGGAGEGGGGRGGRPEGLGGLFGPPPGADGGMGHGGMGHGGRGGGHGGGRPHGPVAVDDAAVQACRSAAQACLDAGTDEATCRDTARTCLHDAFAAALAARCQELTDACTASGQTDCATLAAQCAAGPEAPPAGTCDVADAGTP